MVVKATKKASRVGAEPRPTKPKKTTKPAENYKKRMGSRAHQSYQTQDGTLVPGVTTVVGLLNKPALVRWGYKMGLAKVDLDAYMTDAKQTGTLVHALIAQDFGGEPPVLENFTPKQVDLAENAYLSFCNWAKNHELQAIAIEKQMVSEVHRFGGTCDWYGLYDGRPWVLDFKSSDGVYEEHKIQLAAYVQLLREAGYEVDGARIIQIGKGNNEEYQDHPIVETLDTYWQIFLRLLDIYWMKRGLDARKGGE